MARRRWWPLVGVAWVAACGCRTGPNDVTIDSLKGTELNVTADRMPDQAVMTVLLDFSQIGQDLGDNCPVVTATATVNGVPIDQQKTGGPDPRTGTCQVPTWQGMFSDGFPASADAMVTIQLVDKGAPATIVSALALWADVTLSSVTEPAAPDASPEATLTVSPQAPYSVLATSEAMETGYPSSPNQPLLSVPDFSTSAGDFEVMTTPSGTPNTYDLAFPPANQLARPVTGQISPGLFFGVGGPQITTCTGVKSCLARTLAYFAPINVTLP